jgi:predicted house-cleaning NTP pyrophosphatase (Maf/HAM1 superfamily)
LRKERVVLASASPRRRQLLAQVRARTSHAKSDANNT